MGNKTYYVMANSHAVMIKGSSIHELIFDCNPSEVSDELMLSVMPMMSQEVYINAKKTQMDR